MFKISNNSVSDSSEYNQNAWSVFPKLSWALIAATAWGEKELRDTMVEKCVKIDAEMAICIDI